MKIIKSYFEINISTKKAMLNVDILCRRKLPKLE